jgi:hypothetical protein
VFSGAANGRAELVGQATTVAVLPSNPRFLITFVASCSAPDVLSIAVPKIGVNLGTWAATRASITQIPDALPLSSIDVASRHEARALPRHTTNTARTLRDLRGRLGRSRLRTARGWHSGRVTLHVRWHS